MIDDIAITKRMLVDAVCGVGFPDIETATAAEANNYAIFVGDQHNPRWVWNRDKLNSHDMSELAALYMEISNAS